MVYKYLAFSINEEPSSEAGLGGRTKVTNYGVFSSISNAYNFCESLACSDFCKSSLQVDEGELYSILNNECDLCLVLTYTDKRSFSYVDFDKDMYFTSMPMVKLGVSVPTTKLFIQRFTENEALW